MCTDLGAFIGASELETLLFKSALEPNELSNSTSRKPYWGDAEGGYSTPTTRLGCIQQERLRWREGGREGGKERRKRRKEGKEERRKEKRF